MKSFGEQIAEARTRYRLSQLAVAKIVGVSQFWISYAERGKFLLAEPVATKILLAIHRAGQDRLAALKVLKTPIPVAEQGKFRLPRIERASFKNRKSKSRDRAALR